MEHVRYQVHSEPDIVRTVFFKHFLGYLGIFGVIDAYSATLTLPWKMHGCAPALRHYSFAKRSVLNVWLYPEHGCLDNCSVICKVTLCYVLHQTQSEFWYIQAYSALLSRIPTCWGIMKVYSGLSRHKKANVVPWKKAVVPLFKESDKQLLKKLSSNFFLVKFLKGYFMVTL